MPECFTSGPFDAAPPRRYVDLFVAIPVLLIATLAAVALGLGLGWLAANLN
ncbi:hypothetical protein GTW51_14920 [Aurantimonas aggregata]|uniref:Uncharacterized protein n=1 Tax=Aurantimonas aggregata TaxID=2047720 RepID=A0A6L9MJR3_9HYPH|nr:hypothetical protein [Aurantimonas aggregata]NDV87995.1 hypothetical protein [Aurantimonas aggregata]